ncbi:MAG: hypothetical protein PHV37_04750 [Candidatus Gastranaerophilales bacterium]|nr:hypothetical protein [Candidatus Gastranaerophilales bacterium]
MLVEKYTNESNQRKQLEFKNISKELLGWLEETAIENNCQIEKKEWKSKYNSYVIYDYEPFCSDGFEINIIVSSYNVNYLNFVKFLYENKLNVIDYLNNCINN